MASPSIRALDQDSRSSVAHARAAELVAEQRRLVDRIAAYFREVDEVREQLGAEGSVWLGPRLDPPLEAARHALEDFGERETRVELERVGPAPLPSDEPERRELRSPNETGYGA